MAVKYKQIHIHFIFMYRQSQRRELQPRGKELPPGHLQLVVSSVLNFSLPLWVCNFRFQILYIIFFISDSLSQVSVSLSLSVPFSIC